MWAWEETYIAYQEESSVHPGSKGVQLHDYVFSVIKMHLKLFYQYTSEQPWMHQYDESALNCEHFDVLLKRHVPCEYW
jgi:hypothetical protein